MVIIYTAILGDCDSLKPAPKGADRCFCFNDQYDGHVMGWEITPWPDDLWSIKNVRREAWRIRSVPHRYLFSGYDTIVWVDASFTVTNLYRLLCDSAGHDLSALRHHKRKTCYGEALEVVRVGQADMKDVSEQMLAYEHEGFKPEALSISCILVRQNNPRVTAFNELWDAEIRTHPGDNTQLSLDYCAWKTGIGVHHLAGTRHDNPYAVHDAKDHKKRRKPYR